MTLPIDIRTVIVCDDIRREWNGKAMVIGIYTGDIILATFPTNLSLSFWMQGKPLASGEHQMEFRVRVNEESPFEMKGALNIVAPESDAIIAFVGVPTVIPAPGALLLAVKDGDRWVDLCTKKIIKGTIAASTSL
jgi:hypothetical protein